MSKKNFKSSFDDLLGGGVSAERAKKIDKEVIEETKSTFVVRVVQLDKIKAISYMERKLIKNVLDEAFALYIERYEKENGSVVLPKKLDK